MEYEYMALPPEGGAYAGQCRAAVRNKELADKGWKNWIMIPWYESRSPSVCIVRRELQPKDEPRKLIQQLSDMIYRKSLQAADDLGLVLTEQDLDRLERSIVVRWMKRELTEPFMPTINICRPKDEPRMWTQREIEKIVVMSQPGPRADGGWLGPPLPERNCALKNKEETNG